MVNVKEHISIFMTGLREFCIIFIPVAIIIGIIFSAFYFNFENILLGSALIFVSVYGIYTMGKVKKKIDSWNEK